MSTNRDIRKALQNGLAAPFRVRSIHRPKEKPVVVSGFSEHDPLGVGSVFGGFATAYFESGGWVLLDDLCTHFRLVVSQ